MQSMFYISDDMVSAVARVGHGGPTKVFSGGDRPWLPFVNDEAFHMATEYALWRKHVCTWDDVSAMEESTGGEYEPSTEERLLEDWLLVVKQMFCVVRTCRARVDATVFINWDFVGHNINMCGDETHSYVSGNEAAFNKELIVLVKEPGEELTMQLLRDRMKLVEPWLRECSEYHLGRRSFYFEDVSIVSCDDARSAHQKWMSTDLAVATDYNLCLAASARKHGQSFAQRGEWAEYSSREYLRRVLDQTDACPCILVRVGWGS